MSYLPSLAFVLLAILIAYSFTRYNRARQKPKLSPWQICNHPRRSPSAEAIHCGKFQIGENAFNKQRNK